ncbi:MAG: hypothetical protein ACFCVG_17485 [Kineosporiaceae bacterium]
MRAQRIAAAVAAAAALAGCSADVAPGAAARDGDGEVVVTVAEVDALSAELSEAFPDTADVDRVVVFFSVIADEVRDSARESGALVSADEVRRGVAEQTEVQLSDEAAEVVAVSTMFSQLAQGPDGAALVERISALEPVLNPRYGTWDPGRWAPGENLPIADETLPWLAETEPGAEEEPAG